MRRWSCKIACSSADQDCAFCASLQSAGRHGARSSPSPPQVWRPPDGQACPIARRWLRATATMIPAGLTPTTSSRSRSPLEVCRPGSRSMPAAASSAARRPPEEVSTSRVTASNPISGSGNQTYTVRSDSSLALSPASCRTACWAAPIVRPYRQRRHRALYLFISGGSLPAGLALNASTGVISGIPTGGGSQPSPFRRPTASANWLAKLHGQYRLGVAGVTRRHCRPGRWARHTVKPYRDRRHRALHLTVSSGGAAGGPGARFQQRRHQRHADRRRRSQPSPCMAIDSGGKPATARATR